MKADETLDCVGLYCPMPIFEIVMKLKTMKKGQVLEMLSDDEGIKEDMPAWCKTTGNELLGIKQEGKQYRVYIRKSQD